jgi:hypothetical protein
MNCRNALDTLEAVEVGALAPTDAVALEADRHRSQCAACQAAWPVRQQWEHRLSEAMTAVPIPVGLRERLQQACEAPVIASAVPSPGRKRWRRWSVAAMVLLFAIGVGWWFRPLPQFSDQDLLAAMTADVQSSTPFTGRFRPQLPELWKRYYELNPNLIRGFPAGDHPAAGMVALVPFQFQTGDRQPAVRGRLLILRRDQFRGTPTAISFAAAAVYYTRTSGAYALWTEGDLLFVCLVPSGPADLQRFHDIVTQPRSVT